MQWRYYPKNSTQNSQRNQKRRTVEEILELQKHHITTRTMWPVKRDLTYLSSFKSRCARQFVYKGFETATQELLRKAHLDLHMASMLRRMRLKWSGHAR